MVLVIDFGGQTAHLIGRRLRTIGVPVAYAEPKNALQEAIHRKPNGIILSGGPASVYENHAPVVPEHLLHLGVPVLGICYGWQLMARLLGGSVKNTNKEYGPETLTIRRGEKIFAVPKSAFTVIMSHGDTVTKLPPGFVVAGSTPSVQNTAVMNRKNNLYGVQFHPEADHTHYGTDILKRFVADICRENMKPIVFDPARIMSEIKKTVGSGNVVFAVSGGVDSTVAAYLTAKAIGKKLIPVYVESGLMRPKTLTRVRYIFTKLVATHPVIINARKQFMHALKGITDPERKRKVIGKLYVDLFEKESRKHTHVTFLGQGTIYSDVIESKGTKLAAHIKSHHNVAGLPNGMKLKLLEPLRNYYKDEVREIGRLAGLPDAVLNEQPVPGPGLAVRIRGEVTEKRLNAVKMADAIVVDELKHAGIYQNVFQCFAVMTGAFSTAVKGDRRVYAEVVAVRAYESRDIMTSRWARIPYAVLTQISSRIVNEVPDISRVVYDITSKPPATMEWE